MKLSVETKTIKTPSLTLTGREAEILVILGNSRVIADIVFNSNIAETLESYGLTQQELYKLLIDLPSISEFNVKTNGKIVSKYNQYDN